MNEITITDKEKIGGGWRFKLETAAETEHTVRVNRGYYQDLTGGDIAPEELVHKSFVFLLENEPASAILTEFNLKNIEQYFPVYTEVISEQLP